MCVVFACSPESTADYPLAKDVDLLLSSPPCFPDASLTRADRAPMLRTSAVSTNALNDTDWKLACV